MSLLQQVQRGRSQLPPRILVYGTEGVGKSSLAATTPKPIFIQTEDGLGEIDCDKFPLSKSLEDVVAALTLWVTPWGNDRSESQSKRLKAIKKHASPDRFSESECKTDRLTRYVYRLRDENENGIVESMFAYILNDDGHLQMAVYFDNPKDEPKARALADSVTEWARA